MEELLDKDVAKELLTILAYCEEDFRKLIYPKFIAHLTTLAADSTKEFYIEKNKSLSEQNLSEECKNWLSLLYYQNVDFMEQEKLLNTWAEQERA